MRIKAKDRNDRINLQAQIIGVQTEQLARLQKLYDGQISWTKEQNLLIDQLHAKVTQLETRTITSSHTLYLREDKDAPDCIKDSYGDIALGLCRLCHAGERELDEMTCAARLWERLLVKQKQIEGLQAIIKHMTEGAKPHAPRARF